ncbi:MAG TPA: DoxX family protein, partial [Kribbella sp.]
MTSHPDPHAWQRPASASLVDPEDDLPSSNYAGDFETTAIPRYDSAKSSSGQPFGLIGDPEPLPYVQPGGRHSLGPYGAEPGEIEPDAGDGRARDRRGTQDLGLLLLRLVVGAVLIGHGLQKAFGLWGGPGFDGFAKSLTDMGFHHADILTYVASGGQIACGVFLVLGLFTPVAAAGALAYLVTGILAEAMKAHEEARLSSFLTDGHEYKVILVCVVAAIILIG